MIGIYKLKWNSGYFYFGQATDLLKRKTDHLSRIRNGKHINSKIQNISNKYGLPDFIIVEICSLCDLTEREDYYIKSSFSDPKNCNLAPAAASQFGIKRSEETKKRMAIVAKNRVHTSERCKKVSETLKEGYKNKYYKIQNLKGENNPFYGRKHSKETLEKLSLKRKGLLCGAKNGRAKQIINTETNEIFDTILDAAKSINLSRKQFNRFILKEAGKKYIKI